MYAPDDHREAKLDALVSDDGPFVALLNSLATKCLGDSKFLCGETVTIHDFVVAGQFCNLVLNPNNIKVAPKMKACFDSKAPDRLKTYVTDF